MYENICKISYYSSEYAVEIDQLDILIYLIKINCDIHFPDLY